MYFLSLVATEAAVARVSSLVATEAGVAIYVFKLGSY